MKKTAVIIAALTAVIVCFAVILVSADNFLYGDVNGDGGINGQDLIRLRKYLDNYDDISGLSSVNVTYGADCNGDGTINGRDLIRLRKYLDNYDDMTGASTVTLGPSEEATPDNYFYFTLLDDGTYEVKGGGTGGYTDVVIPSVHRGRLVTRIAESAFSYNSKLKSITIPGSVASIGHRAFMKCRNLTDVTIKDGCKSIDGEAFTGCVSLCSLIMPDSIKDIAPNAFLNCEKLQYNIYDNALYLTCGKNPYHALITASSDIINININENTKVIAGYAFCQCCQITSVIIPDSVIYINEGAFRFCNLKSVTIGDHVTDISPYAFEGCGTLETVYAADLTSWCNINFSNEYSNPLYYAHGLYLDNALLTDLVIPSFITDIKNFAFINCSGLNSLSLPDGIVSIGSYAFSGCESLNNVTLPGSVTGIGSFAFENCRGFTNVVVPANVSSIGFGALARCSSLVSITVSVENAKYHSSNNCLIETASGILIAGCKNSVIPKDGTVTVIGDYAFCGCMDLAAIDLPNSIISIGQAAFRECYSLDNVQIPDNVTAISDYTFTECRNLKNIILNDNIQSIGIYAFAACGLENISIPDSVKIIEYDVFKHCHNLKFNHYDNAAYLGNSGNPYHVLIVASKNTTNINENTKVIASMAFFDNSRLESITIPDSVISIGSLAFNMCLNLSNVKLGNGLEIIGDWAFYYCINLETVKIPDGVTSIGDYAFNFCMRFDSIEIPDSVTYIGDYAFDYCGELTSITIGSGVKSIGADAFHGCMSNALYIKDLSGWCMIDFENALSNPLAISPNMYLNNALFENLVVSNGVTKISNYAFIGCDSLNSISIPDGCETIGEYAFNYCINLTNIRIPNSIISINDFAFRNCSALKDIDFGGTMDEWKKISKGEYWWQFSPSGCTVRCADGTVINIDP